MGVAVNYTDVFGKQGSVNAISLQYLQNYQSVIDSL